MGGPFAFGIPALEFQKKEPAMRRCRFHEWLADGRGCPGTARQVSASTSSVSQRASGHGKSQPYFLRRESTSRVCVSRIAPHVGAREPPPVADLQPDRLRGGPRVLR